MLMVVLVHHVVVLTSILVLLVAAAARSDNTDCRAWRPNTAQNVAADVGTLYWGPACNVVLQNINLTVFCYPNATIHIDQWNMQGGYVAIVGPPEAPWNISDVAVAVTSSSISAFGGPAVGVVLGYGWSSAAANPTLLAATNVSLVSTASTLHSSASSDVSLAAAALGFTAVSSSATSAVDIELQHVSLGAQDSELRTTGAITSAVVSIALPAVGGRLVVSRCNFIVRSTVAVATCVGTLSTCASAVGGVAIGQGNNVTLTDVTQYVAWSNVSCSNLNSYSACSLGGISVAYANADFTVGNITQYVAWSNASTSSAGTYTSSTVGGLSVAYVNALIAVVDISQYVAWSNVSTSSSINRNYSYTSSTVGGLGVAYANAVFTVRNITQYVAWSNATSSSSSGSTYGFSASTIAGISVVFPIGAFTAANITQYVAWSTVSSTSSSSTGSSDFYGFSASAVGGFGVAQANAVFTVADSTQCVAWSNATSSSNSGNGHGYGASTVGGISVAVANAAFTVARNRQYVASCNAWSRNSGGDGYSEGSSTVGGVDVAYRSAQGVVYFVSTTLYMSRSFIRACGYANGGTWRAVCGGVTAAAGNCCVNTSSADDSGAVVAPPTLPPLPPFSPLVPVPSKTRSECCPVQHLRHRTDTTEKTESHTGTHTSTRFVRKQRTATRTMGRRPTPPPPTPVVPTTTETMKPPVPTANMTTTPRSNGTAAPSPTAAPMVLMPRIAMGVSLRSAHQAVTTAATVTAMVAPTAAEFATGVQTLALLDGMPCGVTTVRTPPAALVPFIVDIGSVTAGAILGLTILIAAAAVLSVLIAVGLALVVKSAQLKPFSERLSFTRFPSLPLMMSQMTLQGYCFVGMQALLADDGDRVAGGVALVIAALFIAAHLALLLVGPPSRREWHAGASPPRAAVPFPLRWAVGRGRWSPSPLVAGHGAVFSASRDRRVLAGLLLKLLRPSVLGLIAAVPATETACDARQWALAGCCALHGALIITLVPARVAALNAPTALNSLLLGAAFATLAFRDNEASADCSMAVMVVSGVGVAMAMAVAALHQGSDKAVPPAHTVAALEVPMLAMSSETALSQGGEHPVAVMNPLLPPRQEEALPSS